jgi:hypothetical protein
MIKHGTIYENGLIYINPWTFVHFFWGFVLGFLLDFFIETNYLIMFLLHAYFEIGEAVLCEKTEKDIYCESWQNTFTDFVAFLLGYFVYRTLLKR